MAHFFKYKSPAEVVANAAQLGLHHIAMSDDLTAMFLPLNIAGRSVGNRWAIQPMEGCDGTLDGAPDELTYRRYRRFGAGGAKLIWGEATAIADAARMNPRQLWLHDGTAVRSSKCWRTAEPRIASPAVMTAIYSSVFN